MIKLFEVVVNRGVKESIIMEFWYETRVGHETNKSESGLVMIIVLSPEEEGGNLAVI